MSAQRNISLWEIKNEYQGLLSQLYNHETGEVDMEVDAKITALSGTAENKCIAIASWIKNMEADQKQLEFMKQEILKREGAYEKEITKRLDYLKNNMEGCGITEVKCTYFTLRIKKNPYSTDVTNQDLIPNRFIRKTEKVVVNESPDKNAIKEEVLKTGIQVPGAYVAQKTKLEILTDKL